MQSPQTSGYSLDIIKVEVTGIRDEIYGFFACSRIAYAYCMKKAWKYSYQRWNRYFNLMMLSKLAYSFAFEISDINFYSYAAYIATDNCIQLCLI